MCTIAMIAGLAISVAALPVASQAACTKRTNGTIIGALAGGLLGHTIAGRGSHTEGTLLGATAGGVVGNQVSKCRSSHAQVYHRAPSRAAYASSRYTTANCRYETRPFYDAGGQVVYQPTRVCGRY